MLDFAKIIHHNSHCGRYKISRHKKEKMKKYSIYDMDAGYDYACDGNNKIVAQDVDKHEVDEF